MKRYIVTGMCFLANCLLYCTRMNISIAMIAMVLRNATEVTTNTSKRHSIPTFSWDVLTQQSIIGAYSYGYVAMMMTGGLLAGKLGGKNVIGCGVITTSLLTAMVPWLAEYSVGVLIAVRVFDGFVQGTTSAAIYVILSNWTLPNEKSVMVSIAFSGISAGVIISCFLSGWLCSAYDLGGWPLTFYVYGTSGVVWALIWIALIYETPNKDPCISKPEMEYFNRVESASNENDKDTVVPWCAIFTSPAVWAIMIAYGAYGFGSYIIFTESPIFLSTILGFDVKTAGQLTSLTSFVEFLAVLLTGVVADYIIRHEYLSTLNTRKLFIVFDFGVSSMCFIGVVLANSAAAKVMFISLANFAFAFNVASVSTNPMDLSVKHAAIIAGVSRACGSVNGFLVPMILAGLTEDNNTMERWSILFLLATGILLFGMIFFLIFAGGKEQEWSKKSAIHKDEKCHLID